MKHQTLLRAFVVLSTLATVIASKHFLAEKPQSFKSCKQTDPNFKSCFGKIFETIFKEWKDGVPGLKSLGSLEPLHIKRIGIKHNENSPLFQMDVNLLNLELFGLSKMEVNDISIDYDKSILVVKLIAPEMEMESDYTMKGRILNLPLDGKGKEQMTFHDFTVDVQMHFTLRNQFDHTFVDADQVRLRITDIGGFHMNLENLFNGDKELEESANIIINQNWKEFFAIITPAIQEGVQVVLSDFYKKVFRFVPFEYFIEDISTATEFND